MTTSLHEKTLTRHLSSQSVSFADVVIDDEPRVTELSNGKYCIVALWRYSNQEYNCYRLFRVDSPLFQIVEQDEGTLKTENFFDLSEN